MRPVSFLVALAGSIQVATVTAACDSAPSDGEIALYDNTDCTGNKLNIGALFSCQSWPDFWACSAITRPGVTCDIYRVDNCNAGYIATIDSAGYRNFCGGFLDNIQSVRCRVA